MIDDTLDQDNMPVNSSEIIVMDVLSTSNNPADYHDSSRGDQSDSNNMIQFDPNSNNSLIQEQSSWQPDVDAESIIAQSKNHGLAQIGVPKSHVEL